jgi:RNA polymerase sigma-70 factor (ECF subfamily)
LNSSTKVQQFEQIILPHFDAAYNLTRYLTGNDDDAADVVQEACVRALKFFDGFRGDNARAWLLTIVRRTFYSWLHENRGPEIQEPYSEEIHAVEDPAATPDAAMLQNADMQKVRDALGRLPLEFREVLVMREMEGLSYKEIAGSCDIPIGTVMSRLARGRKLLQDDLLREIQRENFP